MQPHVIFQDNATLFYLYLAWKQFLSAATVCRLQYIDTNAPNFIKSLCLMPNDFTCQG